MGVEANRALSAAIAAGAHTLSGGAGDLAALLELVGDARFVLLGEATHGTHEFYAERARITRALVTEKGFDAIAVEADWPDAYRVNRYVRGHGADRDAVHALDGFERFPSWMWRNTDVVDFVAWLRAHNDASAAGAQVGFYGLDLYSLFTSIGEVVGYLESVDPAGAGQARARYACFAHYAEDSKRYAYTAGLDPASSCEHDALDQLHALQARAFADLDDGSAGAADAFFCAEQNARLVVNAERYYRTMLRRRVSSWNLRDQHMAETLDALARHLGRAHGRPAKLVVWEHKPHVGDARATELGRHGEWTVGQLAREMYGDAARLIGFSTYQGWVTAASEWDGPAQRKRVLPALPGSYEDAFHRCGPGRFFLPLNKEGPARDALMRDRLERAIGVLYLPETERQSHYFHALLPRQFDAVFHFDTTDAVQALPTTRREHKGEAPETYPVGV